MSDLNQKQKFIKQNFEYHARMAAHAFAAKYNYNERQMDIIYQSLMAFMDSGFEAGKIEVKEHSDWDKQEEDYRLAIRDEAIRRGDFDGFRQP